MRCSTLDENKRNVFNLICKKNDPYTDRHPEWQKGSKPYTSNKKKCKFEIVPCTDAQHSNKKRIER